jgi:hypothetical protein
MPDDRDNGNKEAVMSMRRAVTAFATCAVAALVLLSGTAFASHAGATVTCSDGGPFTLRAAENSAGFQSPAPFHVLIFEEGGVLAIRSVRVDGNLLYSSAETGSANNALTEVSCSFTIGEGAFFQVTGVLVTR